MFVVFDGGIELQKFVKIMGLIDKEVMNFFNNLVMCGDFLFVFIQGLSWVVGVGGEVQGVFCELGVNVVCDIDVFLCFVNNVDIVKEFFDWVNLQFVWGLEL